jgi:hypothetical protein
MFGKKKQELQKEIGSGAVAGTGVFGEWSDESDSLTRERRIHDYREMMKDATISGLFNILTMPLLASEYDILPAEDSKEAKKQADFVRANLFEASFRGGMKTPFDLFLDQAMLALLDGFAVFEKVYRLNNGHYEIAKLALRDSRSLEILKDEKGGYSGVKQTVGSESVVIPAYKTFLFTHNKKFDSLYGRSVFYGVAANYDKKRKLEYLDSIAIQNDAIKTKVLVETVEHSGADQSFLGKVVGKLGNLGKLKSVAAIPHGYDLKTLDSDGRDPHQSIERQKSEMAFAVLANFMLLGTQGASSAGSYALSMSQAEIFQMSLQSVLDKLEAHINQFIIADLIELNFANPLYPTFKFSKIDKTATVAIYESFKTLLSKDKVSDEIIKQIEGSTATRLGLEVSKGVAENHAHELSDGELEVPDKHFRNLDKKWKDLENRFLEVSRPIFERVAEDLAETAETTVKLPKEYKTLLTEIFKQAYTEGKIFSANREGRKAGKNSAEFSKEAREYIDWIISKQEQDLTSFLEAESVNEKLLADEDLAKELLKSALVAKISNWFFKRAKPTAGYLVGRGVNAGIYADFADEDLIEYSAVLDGRTTAGCSYLDNKRMKWSEWKKTPDMIPPRHFGCRATLVRVVSGGDISENTPDLKKVAEKDSFQNATKKELVAKNPELEKYTRKEIDAMVWYKTDAGYSAINNALRRGGDLDDYLRDSVSLLEKAISRNKFDSDEIIYRGFSLDRKLKVGESLDNAAFMSVSCDIEVSREFSSAGFGDYHYLLEISHTKGSPMLDIDNVLKDAIGSTPLEESEILLNRGKSVIIESVKYDSERSIYMLNAKFTDETKILSEKDNLAKISADELKRIRDSIKKPISDLSDQERQNILNEVMANPKIMGIHKRWLSDELIS